MPQTHGQMSVFLEEKLNKVVNESESLGPLAPMINILFNVETSQEAFVQFLGMTDLGALVPFDGQYEEGNVYPGYKSRIVFPEFGLKERRNTVKWWIAAALILFIIIKPTLTGLPVALLYLGHGPLRALTKSKLAGTLGRRGSNGGR